MKVLRIYSNKKEVLISFLLLLVSDVFASTKINEAQFVAKVIHLLEQDKSFETSKIDVRIKRIELRDSARNYADWKLDMVLDLGYSYQDTDKNITSIKVYDKKKIVYSKTAKLSATKRFLNNPSSVGIALSKTFPRSGVERYKQNLHTSTYYTDDHEEVLNLVWKYPLLKHDSNAKTLKTYHRNILDLEKKKLSFYENKEDFLAGKLQDFLTWAYYQHEADIFTKHLQKLQTIEAKDKRQILILQTAIGKTKNAILNAKTNAKSMQESLAVVIADTNLLNQKAVLDFSKDVSLVTNLLDYLVNNSRDLHKQKIDQALKRIDISYYKNQSLSKLDFSISTSKILSDGNTQSSTFDNDKLSYKTGLLFEHSLFGNISNESNLQIALLNLQKLTIAYRDKLQDLRAKLSRLNVTLKADKYALDRYLTLTKLARKNSAIEQTIFVKNQQRLRIFIEALNEEKEAAIEHLSAVVAYQRNIINYHNFLDRIIIYQPSQIQK